MSSDRQWSTPFGRFIKKFTVRRLVAVLGQRGRPVTNQAVYSWLWGRTAPRPETARELASISRGHLRLDDIYRQRCTAAEPRQGTKSE